MADYTTSYFVFRTSYFVLQPAIFPHLFPELTEIRSFMQTELLHTVQTLPVMESFYTIQGEGFYQGKAAYFIRLGGCDVGCVWCDVKESWDADKHPSYPIEQIIEKAVSESGSNGLSFGYRSERATGKRIVVVTGGEPLMHDCRELTNQLHKAGFATHIETSGAHPVSGEWDWICLSPKKFKAPLPGILPLAHELKVVIFNKRDFEWAEEYASLVSPSCKLFLQPEWGKSSLVTPLIIDYIKNHPQWEFSLQLHKYIAVP
jgi:7-carboxy-7-deazaguanine synthase